MLIDVALFSSTVAIISYETIKIKDKVSEYLKRREQIISEYDLVVGKDKLNRKIIVSMKETPHLLVCGLSGQGKSNLAEYSVRSKLDVIILNSFEEDFKTCNCKKISELGEIEEYLKFLLNEKKRYLVPKYIVIDELIALSTNKNISKYIIQLLAIGRHYNIYLIGIAQRGLKTELPYKDLFNARLTFRQVESSSYRAILGGIKEDTNLNLKKRHFIMYSNDIIEGKTYDI